METEDRIEQEELRRKIIDMGYCVKNISPFYPIEGVDKDELPDTILMVELCSGETKAFNVFGEKIEEAPESSESDELPF